MDLKRPYKDSDPPFSILSFVTYTLLSFNVFFIHSLPHRLEDVVSDVVSEQKALMVVKDPLYFRTPPPCQPPVNRTKCMKSVLSMFYISWYSNAVLIYI